MEKIKTNYFGTFEQVSEDESDPAIVMFKRPLQIVGTSKVQWNGTKYDLGSTDISQWDGTITADHGDKLSDVIGEQIGLEKNERGIFISGIRYAIYENPLAILARNLLVSGFAKGFSCETLGPRCDQNGIFRDHKLCGLSQVAHPNDKMAYAVAANSRDEAIKNGLDVTSLDAYVKENFAGYDSLGREVEKNAVYDLYGRKITKA